MKAIHWVATIAVALVISALWLGLTFANYGGNVAQRANYNNVSNSPNPLPNSPIPGWPNPFVDASHHDGSNLTDVEFQIEWVQTQVDGDWVTTRAVAFDGNELTAYCNLT